MLQKYVINSIFNSIVGLNLVNLWGMLLTKNLFNMKKTILLMAIVLVSFSCKNEAKTNVNDEEKTIAEISQEIAYSSFGMKINDADALTANRMMVHYNSMKVGDTINAKTKGKISEVCSKKGCWMKLDMGEGNIVRVTFKDYGFFMPLDASGEVVINGKAYVAETSVEDLKHYAEDAGKTAEEIASITAPERTFSFEADGVLLVK